ncbi:hypothetical protein A4X13_0g6375 [Tilletia indica]|uniref:Uncharacterized protein n=1 Tax=Tilletia indica TaxID=43049 RepID=A0A8T8SQ75_9BASI|nr:hypothetical protein A4X13_0g6375 [Tilletia indica]
MWRRARSQVLLLDIAKLTSVRSAPSLSTSSNDFISRRDGTSVPVDDDDCGGVTWKDQEDILRSAFEELDISSSKLTHAMRGGGAQLAHEAG